MQQMWLLSYSHQGQGVPQDTQSTRWCGNIFDKMENIWYWCICIWNKQLGEADEENGYDNEDDADVIFSPRALFFAKIFSTQKRVNRNKPILRQNSVNRQKTQIL